MVAHYVMEKRRPTYDLDAIKTTFGSVDTLAITTSALRDANSVSIAPALSGDRRHDAQDVREIDDNFRRSQSLAGCLPCAGARLACLCEIPGRRRNGIHDHGVQGEMTW